MFNRRLHCVGSGDDCFHLISLLCLLFLSFSFQQDGTALCSLVKNMRRIVNSISNSTAKMAMLRFKQEDPTAAFDFELADADADADIIADADADSNDDVDADADDDMKDDDAAIPLPAAFNRKAWVGTLKLIKDVVTRWNSTFYMLRRCYKLRHAIDFVLLNHPAVEEQEDDKITAPDVADWKAISELCRYLKPFQVATDQFQGQVYPTLGCVSPYISWLHTCISGAQSLPNWRMTIPYPDDDKLQEAASVAADSVLWTELSTPLRDLHEFVCADLIRRWKDVLDSPLMGLASLLHPSWKHLAWYTPQHRLQIRALMRAEVLTLAGLIDPPDAAAVVVNNQGAVQPQQQQQHADFDDFEMNFVPHFGDDGPVAHADPLADAVADYHRRVREIDDEIKAYHAAACIGYRRKIGPAHDPLLWWRNNQARFPHIAPLARKYLCIPCSSAPSERVFSHLNIILKKNSARMLPERVEGRLFLKLNMHLLDKL
jgi:hypothetical protein